MNMQACNLQVSLHSPDFHLGKLDTHTFRGRTIGLAMLMLQSWSCEMCSADSRSVPEARSDSSMPVAGNNTLPLTCSDHISISQWSSKTDVISANLQYELHTCMTSYMTLADVVMSTTALSTGCEKVCSVKLRATYRNTDSAPSWLPDRMMSRSYGPRRKHLSGVEDPSNIWWSHGLLTMMPILGSWMFS